MIKWCLDHWDVFDLFSTAVDEGMAYTQLKAQGPVEDWAAFN
jgi:hypothetical protein